MPVYLAVVVAHSIEIITALHTSVQTCFYYRYDILFGTVVCRSLTRYTQTLFDVSKKITGIKAYKKPMLPKVGVLDALQRQHFAAVPRHLAHMRGPLTHRSRNA